MQTFESRRMARLLGGAAPRPMEMGAGALTSAFLSKAKFVGDGSWKPIIAKAGGVEGREVMCLALQNADEVEVTPIGVGIHRPYRVMFENGIEFGPVSTRQAALKTVYCQFENKRYCQSVDLTITGPERELASYELDKVLGFDLVPPTVGREIARIGSGSVQAWVNCPTAWAWIEHGYDYRKDVRNPWLHRLAAFDFISGEIDRHSNNWIMDEERRVYAIDNGYSFVKGDDRRFMKSSAGKHLNGVPVHPLVQGEIRAIDEDAVFAVLQDRGFGNGEDDGVVTRVRQLKSLATWDKLGELW